jgi:transketolase
MASPQKHLQAMFNREGFPLIDHFIYCICSDGYLMEGRLRPKPRRSRAI